MVAELNPVPTGVPHPGISDPGRERFRTVPNVVTVVRTVCALALAAIAVGEQSLVLIIVGYACYWCGDSLDGFLARKLHQETRIGAVADILADRACAILLGIAVVLTFHWTAVPVIVYLGQFVAVDLVLSLCFLHWRRLLSPNYFYLVDRPLFLLNWSHPAKATNTSSVILVTALTHSAAAGAAVAGVVLVVKVFSLSRIAGLWGSPLRVPAAELPSGP
jgi:CDP-diacylglycerol--glycerol-3-phosphate 3-phosphatidyltransferase